MSDEADRRRAYRELEERGQPVPGKNFGKRMPPMKQKQTPKIKVIDTTKMKQLKLLKKGGEADPLKGLAKMIRTPNLKKDPFSVQQKTIQMAGGGEVFNMTKSTMINPETGE